MKNQSQTNKLRSYLWLIFAFILVVSAGGFYIKKQSISLAVNEDEMYNVDSLIEEVELPSSIGSMSPQLTSDGSRLSISWLEPYTKVKPILKGTSSQLMWSTLEGQTWSTPDIVVTSSHMFTNFADIPSVVSDQNGTLYAHWLEKSNPKVFGYDVKLAFSTGNPRSWNQLGTIWNASEPNRQGYDGFVSIVPDHQGIRAFWIDGRLYNKKEGKPMRLMTANITDKVNQETVLDGNICSCCNTTAVNTSEGPVVFYRGRTDNEIRDIMRVRRDDRGWSLPSPISIDNWHIAGCPVNGPKADAIQNQVVVVWFTGASGIGEVQIAFSTDAGKTFTKGITMDNISPNGPVGRADVVLLENGDAIVSWLGRSTNNKNNVIFLRRVAIDGTHGSYMKIAEVEGSRRVGFPQMERVGNTLYLAWTVPNNDKTKISKHHDKVEGLKMVKLDIKDIPSIH